MAVNLGNLFENANVQNTTGQIIREAANAAVSNDTAGLRQAVEQLKNLMAGDIFTGEITSLENGRAGIELGNGQLLSAALTEQVNVNLGDKLMFQVQSNREDQISLKVLDSDSQEMMMIQKALSAAGMEVNDSSMTMVKALLNNNMPIDRNTLSEVSRQMMNFPEANVDTLVRLEKLGIPVTESNITQFEAYRSYEHQISTTLSQTVSEFSGLMQNYADSGRTTDALQLFSDITAILSDENDVMGEETTKELAAALSDKDLPEEVQQLGAKIAENPVNAKENPVSVKAFVGELMQMNESGIPMRDTLSHLVKSEGLTKVFEEMINKELLLSPEEVSEKQEVKEFYTKLREKTSSLAQLLSTNEDSSSQSLAKSFSAIRDNVNFMNDLSQNMVFMQFPVRLSQGSTQGDLYVYTNKKSLREHPDNISALLHLDMEHLGPMDIYVAMKGKNVNTNFCLESEEMLDFIYEHIDELNQRIDKLGLNFKFSMNVKEKDADTAADPANPVRFTEDFLDKSAPLISVKSYLFDSKA
jgi:hypothetical protein